MMKKRLSLAAISFALALSGCAELKTAWKEVVDKSVDTAVTTVSQKLSQTTSQNNAEAVSSSSISVILSDTEFSKRIIQQAYPNATYNYAKNTYEVLLNDANEPSSIVTGLKDISTDEGDLRYFYAHPLYNTLDLYVFKRTGNYWELVAHKNFKNPPDYLNVEYEVEEFTKIGKDKLAFYVAERGEYGGSVFWVHLANNKLKEAYGCTRYEEYYTESSSLWCQESIRSDLPLTNGFYPLEFNYELNKFKLDSNGNRYGSILSSKKCKVTYKFNVNKQQYELAQEQGEACKDLQRN